MNKLNYVLGCEDGSSNVEIIVWISVVMVIATVLFAFKDTIMGFLNAANAKVSNFKVN
jgi:Flp pilus assembly pilin Flp